jgi:hypothetical protein
LLVIAFSSCHKVEESKTGSPLFAQFNNEARASLNRMHKSFLEFFWPLQKKHEERTLLDSKQILLSYNMHWGVLSMCTPNLLMVDLDYSDKEIGNKERALTLLKAYAKKHDLTFAIRLSDRGLHAFLVSENSNPLDEKSTKIMWELFGDRKYAALSKIRGFCSRIGPKILKFEKGISIPSVLSKKEASKEFISKKPNGLEYIGDTQKIKPDLIKLLQINDELVLVVKNAFVKNYEQVTSEKIDGLRGFIPKDFFKINLLPKFLLKIPKIYLKGTYQFDKGPNHLF